MTHQACARCDARQCECDHEMHAAEMYCYEHEAVLCLIQKNVLDERLVYVMMTPSVAKVDQIAWALRLG